MKRRTLLAGASTIGITLTAGCTSMLTASTNPEDCPDSPTAIEDIDTSSNDRVAVVGSVSEVNKGDEEIIVEGETGRLIITEPRSYPSEGECVRVDAIPQGCIGEGCREGTYVQAVNIESTSE